MKGPEKTQWQVWQFSEQTYRNNFENKTFDWLAVNEYLVSKNLTGKFLAIAVDPNFIP